MQKSSVFQGLDTLNKYRDSSRGGMTIEEAQAAIQKHLLKTLKETRVQVSLAQSRGLQQIQGDHLVRMDGTIGLGVYGSVFVTGMTLEQARRAIEMHLSQSLLAPEISLDVYNLANVLRQLVLPKPIQGWTLTTMREKLVKIGAKVVWHAKYLVFQLAEVSVPRPLFAAIVGRIGRLRLACASG
jgi:hypothetical protein